MTRAAAILIQADTVALIERHRSGRRYFVFPGGGVEPGETEQQAAIREIAEELGLQIVVHELVAEVLFTTARQLYFRGEIVGGTFGTGTGHEMRTSGTTARGIYRAVWLPIDALSRHMVLPQSIANITGRIPIDGWPTTPLSIRE